MFFLLSEVNQILFSFSISLIWLTFKAYNIHMSMLFPKRVLPLEAERFLKKFSCVMLTDLSGAFPFYHFLLSRRVSLYSIFGE